MFPQMLNNLEENMKMLSGKEEPLKKAIVVGDTGNFSEGNLQEAAAMGVEALIPGPQFRKRAPHFDGRKEHAGKKRFGFEDFEYDEATDSFKCPKGNTLTHQCHQKLGNTTGHKYQAKMNRFTLRTNKRLLTKWLY
jgi:hypothetical protein